MAGLFFDENPWNEPTDEGRHAAIARVLRTANAADAARAVRPELSDDLHALARDCTTIAQAWDADIATYRAQRAFGAVTAPELADLCTAIASVAQALDAASKARIAAAFAKATDAAVHARAPNALARALDSLAPETTPAPEQRTGLMGMAGRLARGAGNGISGAVQGAKEAGKTSIETLGAGLEWTEAGTQAMVRGAINPMIATVAGLRATLGPANLINAVANAGTWGIVTAVLFPPAIPVVVGLALLETATETWAAESQRAEGEGAAAHKAAAERRDRAAARVAKALGLSSGAPQAFGTAHVRVVVDPGTGSKDGRVLSGKFAGQHLDDVPANERRGLIVHAPDPQTRAILERFFA